MIYSHGAAALYVNLFIASELNWSERGLVVRQQTDFPDENVSRLHLQLVEPQIFALKVRHPAWCQTAVTIKVNGAVAEAKPDGSGYLTLEREWKNGDLIEVTLPMSLRTETLPGDPGRVAIFYGPILLVGAMGPDGIPPEGQYAHYEKQYTGWPTPPEPTLSGDPAAILDALKPVSEKPLTYRTQGIGHPEDYTLIPFFRLNEQRYTVYWRITASRPHTQ